jgi:hypothetical protein
LTNGTPSGSHPGQSRSDGSHGPAERYQRARCWVVYALLALPAITSLLYIRCFTFLVPVVDDWDFVALLGRIHSDQWTFHDLVSQHNEHRMFFPRLVMLALARLTAYDNRAEHYAGWVMMVVIGAVVLAHHIASEGWSNRAVLRFVPVAWLVFDLRQGDNVLWAYGFPTLTSLATAVAALALLAWSEEHPSRAIWAVILALVSTFSFSVGLILWPVGTVLLWWRERSRAADGTDTDWWALVLWLGGVVLAVTLFFTGYRLPSRQPGANLFRVAKYLLASWGMALTNDVTMAMATGAAVACLAVLLVAAIAREHRPTPQCLFPLGLMALALGNTFLLAQGRVHEGVGQALSGRYASLMLLLFVGLYLSVLHNRRHLRHGDLYLGATVALLAVGIPVGWAHGLSDGRYFNERRRVFASRILNRQYASDAHIAQIHLATAYVRAGADFLETQRLNLFHDPAFPVGLPARDGKWELDVLLNGRRTEGSWVVDPAVEPELRIAGWAVDLSAGKAPAGVLLELNGTRLRPNLGLPDGEAVRRFGSAGRHAGFEVVLSSATLSRGHHVLRINIVSNDGQAQYVPGRELGLDIR